MDDVKSPKEILHLEHAIDKGAAHGIDVIDKISLGGVGAAVVVNTLYHVVTCLARSAAGKDVHGVSLGHQGFSQLGDVDAHSSDGDGVQ
jgi:hypothetical protein